MKQCNTCNKSKELTEFSKNKATKDGLQRKCKSCDKDNTKQWHLNNADKCKEYDKQYKLNNIDRTKVYSKQQNLKHKQKNNN